MYTEKNTLKETITPNANDYMIFMFHVNKDINFFDGMHDTVL